MIVLNYKFQVTGYRLEVKAGFNLQLVTCNLYPFHITNPTSFLFFANIFLSNL